MNRLIRAVGTVRSLIQAQLQGRFLRDTLVLQSGQFMLIILQAATTFALIRLLGPALLGIYTLIGSLAALAGLLDITGSQRVTLTQLAKAIGAEDSTEVTRVLAYFLQINLLYNVPLILIFFVAAPQVTRVLYGSPTIGLWAGALAFTQLTDIPTQLIGMVYQARRTMWQLVSYETGKVAIGSLTTLTLLARGYGIVGVIVGTLALNVIYAGVSIWRYRQAAQSDALLPKWPVLLRQLPTARGQFRLGFLVAIDKNLGGLLDQLTLLFIGTLGIMFMGNFSTALRIVTLPQPLVSGIARNLDTFLPRLAGQITGQAPGQSERSLRSMFIQTTLYTGALWSLLTVLIALGAPFAIYLFFPEYVRALPLVYPLLLQSLGIGLGVGIGSTMRTIGRVEYSILVQIVYLLLIVPMGVLLIRVFGNNGAAWLIGVRELTLAVIIDLIVLRLLRPHLTTPAKAAQPSG